MRSLCQGVRPRAIDLDMKEEEEIIQVGAILLGFGFEPFWPQKKRGIWIWPVCECDDERSV